MRMRKDSRLTCMRGTYAYTYYYMEGVVNVYEIRNSKFETEYMYTVNRVYFN